jgi:hypothetical protein
MREVEPVARLVRGGLALVVRARVSGRRAEHRLPVDDDAVEIGAALVLGLVRVVRPAEIHAGRGEIEVERVVPALAEGLLHRTLPARRRPGEVTRRVRGASDAGEVEVEASADAALEAAECHVQDLDLVVDGPIRDVARAIGVVDDVDVRRHRHTEARPRPGCRATSVSVSLSDGSRAPTPPRAIEAAVARLSTLLKTPVSQVSVQDACPEVPAAAGETAKLTASAAAAAKATKSLLRPGRKVVPFIVSPLSNSPNSAIEDPRFFPFPTAL